MNPFEGYSTAVAFGIIAVVFIFNCGRKMKSHPQMPSSQPTTTPRRTTSKENKLTKKLKPDKRNVALPSGNEHPPSTPHSLKQSISETLEEIVEAGGKKKKRNSYVNLDLQLSEGDEKSNMKTITKDAKSLDFPK